MNKEHIFQVGISVDEDEIVNGINEQIKNVVLKDIEKKYFDSVGYSTRMVPTEYLRDIIDNKIKDIVDENKEEIVKAAGEILAEKFFKTKLAKETLKRVTGGAND